MFEHRGAERQRINKAACAGIHRPRVCAQPGVRRAPGGTGSEHRAPPLPGRGWGRGAPRHRREEKIDLLRKRGEINKDVEAGVSCGVLTRGVRAGGACAPVFTVNNCQQLEGGGGARRLQHVSHRLGEVGTMRWPQGRGPGTELPLSGLQSPQSCPGPRRDVPPAAGDSGDRGTAAVPGPPSSRDCGGTGAIGAAVSPSASPAHEASPAGTTTSSGPTFPGTSLV